MEINKQLFEDVLSGKLKGTFVLRNGNKIKSSELEIDPNANVHYYPIFLNGIWYTFRGELHLMRNNDLDIIDFISDTNMKENELTIEIPDGKIVDWDESKKQNKIVLKDKQLTYKDICKKLFKNKEFFFTNAIGTIEKNSSSPVSADLINAINNSTSYHQLECILAKNKLANVAVYLNDGWEPNLKKDYGYYIEFGLCGHLVTDQCAVLCPYSLGKIVFKSKEAAQQAIKILGEETVKLALEPLGI